ncbi:MAG TPA: alanine racemase [Myxococcales bacterium]|nr:alanine racemase [Myxococcales bacterium]
MSEPVAVTLGDPARRAFDLRIRPTEARIDVHALMHNLREARRSAPRSCVMAVVKADAYGHGATIAAKAFLQAGAEWLGVALVEEGLALRHVGVTAPIVVLGGQYTDYGLLLQQRLTPLVYRAEMIDGLAAAARVRGVAAEAHLKLDTGMGRIGALPHEVPGLIEHLRGRPEVRITGLCSHFANADLRDPTATGVALELFAEARRALLDARQPLQLCHLANSAAVLDLPSSHHDMVRPGLMLYGAVPAPRFAGMAELKPAMAWVTGISHLKRVPAGTPISYGHRWTARRDSLIATLPVGYADGYRRSLTNKAEVLLRGRRVKQVGTVCMDMMMIDATDLPDAQLGDEVVLLGDQGGERITAQDLADLCDTIPYELFCAIGARVPRVSA